MDEDEQCPTGVVYKVGPRGRVRELPGGVDDVGLCPSIDHGLPTNIEFPSILRLWKGDWRKMQFVDA